MGCFDTVRCYHPLPGIDDAAGLEFQTKDLDCVLTEYTITTMGCLREKGKLVDFSGPLVFYTGSKDKWLEFRAQFKNGRLLSIQREDETMVNLNVNHAAAFENTAQQVIVDAQCQVLEEAAKMIENLKEKQIPKIFRNCDLYPGEKEDGWAPLTYDERNILRAVAASLRTKIGSLQAAK